MLEPPAKRLRILQSVEVDETNPDYVAAKQKQQERFKGRLEKLFAKYGDMHESMSDEIDFKTGKVVVDRGHLRRVERHMKRKGPGLLDSLLEPQLQRDDTPDTGEEQAESEDELAPSEMRKRKRDDTRCAEVAAQSSDQHDMASFTAPLQHSPAISMQRNVLQTPNNANPTANLLQQIQQTTLDQQAQAALIANLNQTIAQAVQQAVAPLLSVLQTTPNGQAARTSLSTAQSLHAIADDNVRPAADPKWYFPPLSHVKETSRVEYEQSSPPVIKEPPPLQTADRYEDTPRLVSRRRSPTIRIQKRRAIQEPKKSPPARALSIERPQSSHSLPDLHDNSASCLNGKTTIDDFSDRKTRRASKKYNFTQEDDLYISRSRELHNMTFREIKANKAKWSTWPVTALYNHWNMHLKDKNVLARDTLAEGSKMQHDSLTPPENEDHFFSSKEIPETSSASHHLPTPSSLEQEDNRIERAILPSSSQFDDDELDLLSLAGADISDVLHTHSFRHNDYTCHAPDDPLPSIEGAEFRNEDELQLEMLKFEESPTPEPLRPKDLPSTIPETQESAITFSSPTRKREVHQRPQPEPKATYRAISNSSDELDLIGANDEPKTPHTYIKCESTSPQATRILCSSPAIRTPRPVLQSSGLLAKSTGKLDRRAYLKEVKQSWTKTKGKTPGSQKRRSLNIPPMAYKRAREELEGNSEDELAL